MGRAKAKGKSGNWYTRHFGFKGLKGTGTEPGVVEQPEGWAQKETDYLVANVPEADQRTSYPGHGKTLPSDQGEGPKEKAIAEKKEKAEKEPGKAVGK
jgi:hypothetical protein